MNYMKLEESRVTSGFCRYFFACRVAGLGGVEVTNRFGRFGRDRGSPDRPALDGDPAEDLPQDPLPEIRLRIHSRIRDYSYLGAWGFQPRKRDVWHGILIRFW
jgi:hypothetical protein